MFLAPFEVFVFLNYKQYNSVKQNTLKTPSVKDARNRVASRSVPTRKNM